MILFRSFLIGFVSGLRSMTGPAVASCAVVYGDLDVSDTPLSFMGCEKAAQILTVAALGEMIADKLPAIPDRRRAPSFIWRITSGALSGATIGASEEALVPGLIAGIAGTIAGTLGGAEGRKKLADLFGCDLPAALVEDATAVGLGMAAVNEGFPPEADSLAVAA